VLRHQLGRHERRPVHPESPPLPGPAADTEEAGDGGQSQLDHGVRDRSADLALVGVLEGESPDGDGLLVGGGIGLVGAHHPGGDAGEVRRLVRARLPEGVLDELRLGLDVEAGEGDADVVAVAAELVHGHLEGGRRRLSLDAPDAHPIGAGLVELDGVEPRGHIGAEVRGAADLVQQLRGDGADRHLSPGAVVLADHGRPVDRDVRPREAGAGHAGHLGEERVVAPGGLRAALDDVAGDDATGESVPVVAGPAVVPRRRAAHHGGVGGAPGHDDVRAAAQRLDDAPAAQVGVGADEP
jgi:hypothetical protein